MSKPSRKSPPPPTPAPGGRSKAPLMIGGITLAAVVIGAFMMMQTERADPAASTAAASTPASSAAAVPPPAPAATEREAALTAHPQKELPPLELPAYPLGRSPEVIRAAYVFAAEHPEVLTYVPCFCGCERSGHKGNEDCFVKSRGANGDVTQWEPHGMECNVCVDVATQAKQMYSSGASVRDIRAAVEKKWASQSEQMHTHTPTPAPPGK
jgi:hypothetical protein